MQMIGMTLGIVLGLVVGAGVGFWGPWMSSRLNPVQGSPEWILMVITVPVGMGLFAAIGGMLGNGCVNPAQRTLFWKFSWLLFALGIAACLHLAVVRRAHSIRRSAPEGMTSDPRVIEIFHDAERGVDHLKAKYPNPADLAYRNPNQLTEDDVIRVVFALERLPVLEAILQAGYPKVDDALRRMTAVPMRIWKDGVEALLKHGADPNQVVSEVLYGLPREEPTYRLLLQYGAKPAELLVEYKTSSRAQFFGKAEWLEVLLSTGSDFCVRDSQGKTTVAYLEEERTRVEGLKPEYQKSVLPAIDRALERAKSCVEFKPCSKK